VTWAVVLQQCCLLQAQQHDVLWFCMTGTWQAGVVQWRGCTPPNTVASIWQAAMPVPCVPGWSCTLAAC
jgi:hypothetical protein